MELAIIAIAVSIFFGAVAYWQSRPSQRLARGQLNDTRLVRCNVNGSRAQNHVWILPWESNLWFVVDLNVMLTNEGNKSVDDVIVSIRFPSLIYLPEVNRELAEWARLRGVERVIDGTTEDGICVVTYKIRQLDPGIPVVLNDFVVLSGATRRHYEGDYQFKDDEARVRWQLLASWGFSVAVNARDMPATERDFHLWSLKPGDPLLKDMDDVEGAYKLLKENPASAYKSSSAILFQLNKPEESPVSIPWGPRLTYATLKNVTKNKGTYFPEVGFLPLFNQAER